MKAFVTALDQSRNNIQFSRCGYTNQTLWMDSIQRYGNITYSNIDEAEIICVFVTFLGENYNLDEVLMDKISKENKPIIIFDYTEYGPYNGHIRTTEYNLYGYKLEFNDLKADKSYKIHSFLLANQNLIKCYFKRELGSSLDLSVVPFNVYPIEFIGDVYNSDFNNIDTKDNFYNRLCIYNFVWGYSNNCRPHLHGAILMNWEKFASRFALSYKQATTILNEKKDYFILLTSHDWYERVDLNLVNKNSMMIIDLYGCGKKCFRNVESTKYAVSIKQDPSILQFTYKWEDGKNCITLPVYEDHSLNIEKSIEIMLSYRHEKRDLLYDIYLNSMQMNRLYSPENYVPNHIIKNINKNL